MNVQQRFILGMSVFATLACGFEKRPADKQPRHSRYIDPSHPRGIQVVLPQAWRDCQDAAIADEGSPPDVQRAFALGMIARDRFPEFCNVDWKEGV